MSLRDDMMNDLADSFLNTDEFGEVVTLTRGGKTYEMQGLYDSPAVSSDVIDIDSIAHSCRLIVRASDLPDSKPRKGDTFALASNQFHTALNLEVRDFVFEKDGTVIFQLREIA